MAKPRKDKKRRRRERRFFPQSTANPWLVRILGGGGAILLGAGAWGQFAVKGDEPLEIVPYLLAAGAGMFGMGIWFGTSGDPVVRVGDGGIAVDRASTQRMPWYNLERIQWDSDAESLKIEGDDETGKPMTLVLRRRSQPLALAWVLKEAQKRAKKAIEVDEDVIDSIGETAADDGERVEMDPLHVVGKKCATSGKAIAYEPDARVCPNCERVYHKTQVPKRCACGESLAHLVSKKASGASAA